ncbi:MAG TPA: hypothetical protein VG755_24060 [Nannocystaceae bacterium]|nr:hypothetical protein [Nannocystaceae bacterium]
MATKLPAILLCLVGLGVGPTAFAGEPAPDRPARPVLRPTPLPRLRTTPTRAHADRPASDATALIAALGQRPQRPRTLLVPLVKRSAIGVVIVRRF